MSEVYNIGLQRYRDLKIRVCDKDSILLLVFQGAWQKGGGLTNPAFKKEPFMYLLLFSCTKNNILSSIINSFMFY